MDSFRIMVKREADLLDAFIKWLEGIETDVGGGKSKMRLQPNQASRLHNFWDAATQVGDGRVFNLFSNEAGPLKMERSENLPSDEPIVTVVPFIVKHDWAGALRLQLNVSDKFRLPYPNCAFEFMVSGRPVIVFADERNGPTGRPNMTALVQFGKDWLSVNAAQGSQIDCAVKGSEVICFLDQQVQAICIALSAQVAETEQIRAPEALNKKRLSKGRAPLYDHHVVNLAKRHRSSPSPFPSEQSRSSPRLHFRRGHWRHYDSHRTWVEWTLVGDPSLGFIDKDYTI